jgi:type I restriction enzyme M protein
MPDIDTRRRIDSARDILVGKVPDPKSQVEQITSALIYKFMDDMDAESEEMGGIRKFFAGEFSRYGWAKLIRSGLGGYEILNLYAEAINKMPENPGIPTLFRNIFKNAYLPYRDPETLHAFLKVIDEFEYDHSERLGDAFEYLLSVLGSQGEAGQFRTPRHIIDFMVEIIDPKKNETVLDPACGTAGFLISSYKHILTANTDANGNSTLTPDEQGRLASNFRGYDISPDMVRLSLANMYLHDFVDPHIYEYDTLTSLDRWNEYADVILANPPFMSPKGGIKPHNRFSIQSKRSEVLFVDYMAEHLTPNGRAGIIVPEGVIFQSGSAYVQLRKMLIEQYLVAVISLPGGVFNPYSGVKTSILILDKSLGKKTTSIAFFKIENDGFDLGAQRRPKDRNDLPQVQVELSEYLHSLHNSESLDDFKSTLGFTVSKEKILANGDNNLSSERYREIGPVKSHFPFVPIKKFAVEIQAGFACGKSSVDTQGVPHIRPMNITEKGQFTWNGTKYIPESEFSGKDEYALMKGDVLFNNTNSKELIGKTCLIDQSIRGGFSNHMTRIRTNPDLCSPQFLALLLHDAWKRGLFLERANKWIGQAGINMKSLSEFEIPLPPLEVQREIVTDIESYQKIIDGARAVVDNYHPHVPIHLEWPMVSLGDLCKDILSGGTPSTVVEDFWNGDIPWMTSADIVDLKTISVRKYITQDGYTHSSTNLIPKGNIIVVTRVGLGKVVMNDFDICISQDSQGLILDRENVIPAFLLYILADLVLGFKDTSRGTTIQGVTKNALRALQIPCPPIVAQQQIVTEIEAEQAIVFANKDLITRFEKKIQSALASVWGEENK